MKNVKPSNDGLMPAQLGGRPVSLELVITHSTGRVESYDLGAGDILSVGRTELVPDALLSDLIDDEPASQPQSYTRGALTSRWPHLRGQENRIRRLALGIQSGGIYDLSVSDHALAVFWDPGQGWLVVNCSGSGKEWATQRWTHLPAGMPAGQAIAVEDRLAVWISSDYGRDHLIQLSQRPYVRREHLTRLQSRSVSTGTVQGPPPVVLTEHQREAFVRQFEQFLRWPPLPRPRVTPNRHADYLRMLPQGAADNFTLRTAITAAVRRNDFEPNGTGSSPKDNLHFIQRVLQDEARLHAALISNHDEYGTAKTPDQLTADAQTASTLLTFARIQQLLNQLDQSTDGWLETQRGGRAQGPERGLSG